MNCEHARQLIDGPPATDSAEAAAFEAHLAGCAACAQAVSDRQAARQLLQPLRDEKPTSEETDTMWQAVAQALPTPFHLPRVRPSTWAAIRRVGGVAAAIAICLTTAYMLGQERYGRQYGAAGANLSGPAFRSNAALADRSRRTASADDATDQRVVLGVPLQTETAAAGAEIRRKASAAEQSEGVTRGLGMMVKDGDITPSQSSSASAGDEVILAGNDTNLPELQQMVERLRESTWDEANGQARMSDSARLADYWNVDQLQDLADGNTAARYSLSTAQREQTKGLMANEVKRGRTQATAGAAYESRERTIAPAETAGKDLYFFSSENRDASHVPEGANIRGYASVDKGAFKAITPQPSDQSGAAWGLMQGGYGGGGGFGGVRGDSVGQATSTGNLSAGYPVTTERYAGVALKAGEGAPAEATDIVLYSAVDPTFGAYFSAGDFLASSAGKSSPADAKLSPQSPTNRADDTETAGRAVRFTAGQGVVDGVSEAQEVAAGGQATQDAPPPAPTATAGTAQPPAVRLIKTGDLRAEVDDYAAATKRIDALVVEHGAMVADGGTQEQAGGALSGNFVIRVAPARFDDLFAALRQVGRIEAENVKVADVTAQYVDMEARIKSLEIAETRLQELAQKELKAEKAGDQMKALLEIERELNRVRTEIEQHEGELRVLANRVAFSTINLAIHEPPRIVPAAQLGVEVPTLDAAVQGLQQIVTDLGARLATGQIEKRDGGALAGKYTLTVKLRHFGAILDQLAALGRVDQRNVRDWHAPDAAAPWADQVDCAIELVLFERPVTLPGGEVALEVADVSATLVSLRELLPAHQASVATSQTNQRDDGSSVAMVEVRVPAGGFAEVADAIAALGRVLQRNLAGSTQRPTGGAAATPVQLAVRLVEPARQIPSGRIDLLVEQFEPARQKLVTLVQQQDVQVLGATSAQRQDGTWVGAFRLGIPAPKMEAAIAALEGLGKVTTRELTGLGLGELARVNPQALGVLDLTLAEKAAYSPGGQKAGNTLRNYLRDGLSGLYESLGLIVYGLVVMLPWLLIVLLATWLIVRAWKKRAARRQPPVT